MPTCLTESVASVPPATIVLTVSLEAVCPERNHFRAYSMEVGRNLFGGWQVTIRHGRIGARGRVIVRCPSSEAETRELVLELLSKRLQARKRVGIDYQIREYHADDRWREWIGTNLDLES